VLTDGDISTSSVISNTNPLQEFKNDYNISDIRYFATTFPESNLIKKNKSDYREIQAAAAINEGQIYCLGNNQAIAANAYYSSNFNDSIVITFMDEGEEQNGFKASVTVWHGYKNSLGPIHTFGSDQLNIIRIWSNIVQTVFSSAPSLEAFSKVVEMSKSGNPDKYSDKMFKMITENHEIMSMSLTQQNIRKYFNLFSENNIESEDKNDIAAGIQKCTTDLIIRLLKSIDEIRSIENLCLSGLASFNTILLKDISKEFPNIGIHTSDKSSLDEVACGAARFVWHTVLRNNRQQKYQLPSKTKLKRMKKSDLISVTESIGLDIDSSRTRNQIILEIENLRD